MLILPGETMGLLSVFASAFSARVFEWVKVLVVGAIHLLDLFSFITPLSHHLSENRPFPPRTAASCYITQPTFRNAIVLVRPYLWLNAKFSYSPPHLKLAAFPEPAVQSLLDTLARQFDLDKVP